VGRLTSRHGRALLLVAPAILFVALVLLVPLLTMGDASLHREEFGELLPGRTLNQYDTILRDADYLRLFRDTFGYAALVTLIAALLGYPVALHLVSARPRYRPFLYFVVAAPLLVNAVVRTYGWLLILGRTGLINALLVWSGLSTTPLALTGNAIGLVIGGVEVFLPFMILSLVTALSRIEPRWIEASALLGASSRQTFRNVILPLTLPGLATGSLLVFTLMLGAFVTPLILGGTALRFLSVSIFVDALVLFNLSRATALAVILLFLLAVGYALQMGLRRLRMRAP
jgi:putative spermidine/putrescine transport system permease protein